MWSSTSGRPCWHRGVHVTCHEIPSRSTRIHGAAIYGVPWIPSIYPLYVSIYIPAPWILWVSIVRYCKHPWQILARNDMLANRRIRNLVSCLKGQGWARSFAIAGWVEYMDGIVNDSEADLRLIFPSGNSTGSGSHRTLGRVGEWSPHP